MKLYWASFCRVSFWWVSSCCWVWKFQVSLCKVSILISGIMLFVIVLSDVFLCCSDNVVLLVLFCRVHSSKCHSVECHSAECPFDKSHPVECHSDDCIIFRVSLDCLSTWWVLFWNVILPNVAVPIIKHGKRTSLFLSKFLLNTSHRTCVTSIKNDGTLSFDYFAISTFQVEPLPKNFDSEFWNRNNSS